MSYKDFMVSYSKLFHDVVEICPSMSWDIRGNIYTAYARDMYQPYVPPGLNFIHDKFALSNFNVLRGLHGDNKTWKLVSCVYGKIFEVIADMRQDSPTYQKWEAYELDSGRYSQVLIPPGFVNGYYVLSDTAVFYYKLAYLGEYIDANEQMTISWDDPALGIKWPCNAPILQERDIIMENK